MALLAYVADPPTIGDPMPRVHAVPLPGVRTAPERRLVDPFRGRGRA